MLQYLFFLKKVVKKRKRDRLTVTPHLSFNYEPFIKVTNMSINAVIATNRFGLGARPDELSKAKLSPKKWLINQLNIPSIKLFDSNAPHSDEISIKLAEYRSLKKKIKTRKLTLSVNDKEGQTKHMMQKVTDMKQYPRDTYRLFTSDSLKSAITSENSLQWRLLDFFSNHFSVTAQGPILTALAPTLEREAIAPHLLGKFSDMLMAVSKHPAMLLYLNNERSFGPNSTMGKRGKGLNENLAREIIELHTLGVNGGYTQSDVTELAKGITGWSVSNPLKENETGFKYRLKGHEPGTRTLLGKSFKPSGIEQGESMLRYLADQQSTAKYLCFKLARHFINDNPPELLVNKLVSTWSKTEGDIKAVMITLINTKESWQVAPKKFKTPREFIISTMRVASLKKINTKQLLYALNELGHKPFNAGSPAGFSDVEQDWNGSSALMARIDLSAQFSSKRSLNAERIMKKSFDTSVSTLTYETVLRAESRQQASTLFFMSPEFQRR